MLATETSIQHFVEQHKNQLSTPYYLIDEKRILDNLKKIAFVREQSGAKSVLALKCFSTWSVFNMMRSYMDGTTSSSLFEARLGFEKFGKEVHAYSVAFSDDDIDSVKTFATKVIFNSLSQLRRHYPKVKSLPIGLRVNPGVSYSHFDLADPARRCSRLGVTSLEEALEAAPLLSGAMFHCNCENDDFEKFSEILDTIGEKFGPLLKKLKWVSLGGGIYFTKEGYPLEAFCGKLSDFARRHNVEIYLEPGETAVTQSGFFVTRVLDIVHNEADIAIVDSAVETHMLDLLIYESEAKREFPAGGPHRYTIAGRTCLAGDVFGTYDFPEPLKIGDLVTFSDAAGYTMVKKNWFNGIPMPAIVVRRLNGHAEVVKSFRYEDFVGSLS